MKVVMRIRPDRLGKIPTKSMPVGPHIVTREKQVFYISKEDKHHLDSVCTKHWVEVKPYVNKPDPEIEPDPE